MKKGIVYDLLKDKSCKIDINSNIQLISNTDIAKCIYNIIKYNIVNYTANIISNDSITIKNICNILNIEPNVLGDSYQSYYYNNHMKLFNMEPKTCEHYLKELINERME